MRRLLQHITPPFPALLASLVIMLATALTALLSPLLAGELTRTILATPEQAVYPLTTILFAWAALLVTRTMLELLGGYLQGMLSEKVATSMRNRVYEHLQALPLPWHQARKRGEVLTLLTNDADSVSSFVAETLLPALPTLLTLAGAFLMMLKLNVSAAIIIIIGMPLYFLMLKIIGRKIRPLSRAWVDQYGVMVSRAEENLTLLAALKAFGRESIEAERFRDDNRSLLNIWRHQLRTQLLLSPAISLLAGLGVLLILWLSSVAIVSGAMEPADMVTLLLYGGILLSPLSSLANIYGEVQRVRGSAERLVEFFDELPEPHEGNVALDNIAGDIVFDKVSFSYQERKPILNGFNLRINAGETIAITGSNGAGKSTLAHLLMRFSDPDRGVIRIDGIDTRDATIRSVRQQIGLVAQDALLLNGTIAENIAYGREDANREQIEAAAIAARAHDFISALPQGYNTLIGDQGIRLSGGQRQRVSLARTLLRNPPILILDEATAMFDPKGEEEFIAKCHQVLTQKTVIVITHRPASLALADRVLVLEDGKLVPSKK